MNWGWRELGIFLLGVSQPLLATTPCFPFPEKEPILKAKGFHEGLIEGFDKVTARVAFARLLRGGNVTTQTHLEYFDSLVQQHMDYAERGLRSAEALEYLQKIRQMVRQWRRERSVTYERFINLNELLSHLIATEKDHSLTLGSPSEYFSRDNEYLRKYLGKFPEVILMPMVDGNSLGVLSMRHAFSERVYPLRLTSRPHGNMDPGAYFGHGKYNAAEFEALLMSRPRIREKFREFHDHLISRMSGLSPEKREPTEFVYWGLIHEMSWYLVEIVREKPYKKIKGKGVTAMESIIDDFSLLSGEIDTTYLHLGIRFFNGAINHINSSL